MLYNMSGCMKNKKLSKEKKINVEVTMARIK